MTTIVADTGTLVTVAQSVIGLFAEWPINLFLVIGIAGAVAGLIFKFVRRSKG